MLFRSTPLTLQVFVNAIGLTAGSYSGTILFNASSTTNGQIVIPVNLTVQASSSITANPASLTFQYQIGGSVPNQQSVQLNSSAGAVAYSIAANSSGWLNASPSSGTTPSSIQISINPISLTAGTYSGNILVQASAANGSQTIPVVLTVTSPPPITSSLSALNFTARVGGGSPVAQVLQISRDRKSVV